MGVMRSDGACFDKLSMRVNTNNLTLSLSKGEGPNQD